MIIKNKRQNPRHTVRQRSSDKQTNRYCTPGTILPLELGHLCLFHSSIYSQGGRAIYPGSMNNI